MNTATGSNTQQEYSSIRGRPVVVAYDGSEPADAALRWAAHEAGMNRLPLQIVVGWEPPRPGKGRLARRNFDESRARLLADQATELARAVAPPSATIHSRVIGGRVADTICDSIDQAQLLVMGTAGHLGAVGALMSSVSREVIEKGSCGLDLPVVLLGPHADAFVERRVLVPCANGRPDHSALTWAVQRVKENPQRVLHLLDSWIAATTLGFVDEQQRSIIRERAERAHATTLDRLRHNEKGIRITDELAEGKVADVEYARSYPGDLIVVAVDDLLDRPRLSSVRCPVVLVPQLAPDSVELVTDRLSPASSTAPVTQVTPVTT